MLQYSNIRINNKKLAQQYADSDSTVKLDLEQLGPHCAAYQNGLFILRKYIDRILENKDFRKFSECIIADNLTLKTLDSNTIVVPREEFIHQVALCLKKYHYYVNKEIIQDFFRNTPEAFKEDLWKMFKSHLYSVPLGYDKDDILQSRDKTIQNEGMSAKSNLPPIPNYGSVNDNREPDLTRKTSSILKSLKQRLFNDGNLERLLPDKKDEDKKSQTHSKILTGNFIN